VVNLVPTAPTTGRAPSASDPLPVLPALVRGSVAHQRREPVRHGFRHRVYLWLVDLDALPRLPWYLRPLAGFPREDHFGDGSASSATLRDAVQRLLRERGVDLPTGSRFLMLTNARVLGHVFNPLTVVWCLTPRGRVRCVVAEVHNTYGGRHGYVLEPDDAGRAHTDKKFFVSPFNDISGHYLLQFDLGADRVRVAVRLVRDGRAVFDAEFTGQPTPATRATLLRTALRMPAMPLRVSVLIRLHGVWLWLRRLPLVPRPASAHRREGVT
jgi:DUF1365 family protein